MIPKGWDNVKLESIASKISDGIHTTPHYVESSDFFFINGNNLKDNRITIFENTKYVSEEEYSKHKKELGPRSILMSINGTIGSLAHFNNEKVVLGKSVAYINLKKNVFKKFVYYCLNTIKTLSYFETELTGSTIRNLSIKSIKNTPILIPPVPEQAAIADLLSTWDHAIEKTERLIAVKEKRFTSLVKSLITDKCDSWDHPRADKIFRSISEKQNDHEELLSVTQDRGVIPRSMLEGRVMSPESGTDTYKLIKVGDFAISLRSFQGGIEYSRYQGLISPAYTVLRAKLEIDVDFYRHFFKSYFFIEKYLSIAVIGIRDGKQISIPDFMTVKIPLPTIEEQKQIAALLTTARQEIDLLKKQADAYRKQKRGLMQRLLTGEWRVRVG